uniref:F-box domain-containing protein n=1 Tax=Leersia perrieri TaxID=77586 RepID=A0A0D9WUL3_9ORYZ
MASLDDLPVCILQCIVMLLPLLDAVRISTLSRRLRAAWMGMDTYQLDASVIPDHVAYRNAAFGSLVDDVVFNHSGPGIKFISLANTRYGFDGDQRVTAWLNRLASPDHHRLETLDVDIGAVVHTPASLFRCETLVDLRLMVHGNARGLGAVHLPALRRLCLEHVVFSSTSFQNLMDGCQSSLEMLHLIHCVVADREDDAGSINIRGEALRRVVFNGITGYGMVPFEVSAPNVDEFVFSGRNMVIAENGGVRRLVARKLSLLMDDKVWLYRMFAPLYFLSVGTNMARIISGFHGLLELVISGWSIEYLSRIVHNVNLPEWGIEVLRVEGMWPNQGQAGIVLRLLRSSPCLKDLYITNELDHPELISTDANREDYPETPQFLFEAVPGRLSHLKFFLMRNFTGDLNEMSIVHFVRGSSFISSIDHPDDFRVMDVFGHNWINTINNLQLL